MAERINVFLLVILAGSMTLSLQAKQIADEPECMALTHLELQRAELGLTRAEDTLEHLRTRETPIGTRVSFRQYYKGIPVWDTRIHVFLDDAGGVRHIAGGTFPVEDLETSPTIPSRQVLARARAQTALPGAVLAADPELIVRTRKKGILAWRAIVFIDPDQTPIQLILDATDGSLLETTRLTSTAGDPAPCEREWIIEGDSIETTVHTFPSTGNDPFNVFVGVANTWGGSPETEATQPATTYGAGIELLPGIEYEITVSPTCATWDTFNSTWGLNDVFYIAINSVDFYWLLWPLPSQDRFCTGALDTAEAIPGELWTFGGDLAGDDALCVGAEGVVFTYQETDLSKTVYLSLGLETGRSNDGMTDPFPSWGSFRVVIQPETVVFDPNPMTTMNDATLEDDDDANDAVPFEAYVAVDPLPLLTQPAANEPWKLIGPYCEIDDWLPHTTGVPTSADGRFGYLRDCNHFEAVMCYYHLTRSQQYIQSLGFIGAMAIADFPIRVDPHGLGNDLQAYFVQDPPDSATGYLKFGDGPDTVDVAEDGDVILHEYGHAIQNHQAPGLYFEYSANNVFGPETRALGEAFGDYWSSSTFEQHNIASGFDPLLLFEWTLPDASQRRLDRDKLYPADMHPTSEHSNGEIFSQALWEIRSSIGRETADYLVLLSHWCVDVDPLFTDGALALLEVDDLDNDNDAHAVIVDAFLARGIFRKVIVNARDIDNVPLPTPVEITASEPDLNDVQTALTPVTYVKPFKDTLSVSAGLLTDYLFDHWEVDDVDRGSTSVINVTLDQVEVPDGGLRVTAVYSFTGVGACSGADINGDTKVNGADLSILLGAWATGSPVADLNNDGWVDGVDLAILLGCWAP